MKTSGLLCVSCSSATSEAAVNMPARIVAVIAILAGVFVGGV
jgi:hypothetical protein